MKYIISFLGGIATYTIPFILLIDFAENNASFSSLWKWFQFVALFGAGAVLIAVAHEAYKLILKHYNE